MGKIGRNAPCPCGSGKKYKKCCLAKAGPPVDLLRHKLGKAYDDLMERLLAFAHTDLGDNVLAVAAAEFLLWPEDEVPEELIDDHLPLFMPWFLFNWVYDPDDTDAVLGMPANRTIAGIYLSDNAPRLDELQVRLAEAAMDKPLSFHEVTGCQPGRGFSLKDIFTGAETRVLDKTASETVEAGDILFASVATVKHVSILMGCSTIIFQPSWKPAVINLRKHLKKRNASISDAIVAEYDVEIRDLFFEFYEDAQEPPQMVNTDGEPMAFHTLRYEIDDPGAAFEKLCGLAAAVETPASLMETATLDEKGRLVRVAFPWLRSRGKSSEAKDSTVLGHLTIDGRYLQADVNSAERAERIAGEIEARLGAAARHVGTEAKDLEEMWAPDADDPEADFPPLLDEELKDLPELRDRLVSAADTHWKGWINEKISALGGQTPRQAVRTADGRESVEALLLDARRAMERDGILALFDDDPIERVRRRLGLDRPLRSLSGSGGESFEKIYGIIASFGMRNDMEHITELAARLCRRLENGEEFSLARGRPDIWAAAIIYVVAQLNYIFDPDNAHHMKAEALCEDLGTKQPTVYAKSLQIRQTCDIYFGDPDYSLPEIAEMFSVYQTKDGLFIPKSIMDDMMADDPFDLSSADDYGDEPRPSSPAKDDVNRAPIEDRPASKKDRTDDKPNQLSLFDDD